MRQVTETYYVYLFSELEDKAKEKAMYEAIDLLGSFVTMNIKEDVNQFCKENWGGIQKTLPDVGLSANPDKVDYSVGGRGEYARYTDPIWLEDFELLVKEMEKSGYSIDKEIVKEYNEVW